MQNTMLVLKEKALEKCHTTPKSEVDAKDALIPRVAGPTHTHLLSLCKILEMNIFFTYTWTHTHTVHSSAISALNTHLYRKVSPCLGKMAPPPPLPPLSDIDIGQVIIHCQLLYRSKRLKVPLKIGTGT